MLPLAACHHDKGKNSSAKSDTVQSKAKTTKYTLFKPYAQVDNYIVTDTGYYNEELGDGVFAVIKRNDQLIDTIDKAYGMNPLSDNKYLYYTIRGMGPAKNGDGDSRYKTSIMAAPVGYKIVKGDQTILFNKLTPDFDDWFSSPAIINKKVYYWQIRRIDSMGSVRVSAAEFDPKSQTTRSHYLLTDTLETDDQGYFPLPILNKDTIYFHADKKLMKFSKNFESYN